jgi:hypothetical protein
MNKEFVPYEQALELKELGFDEPCLARHIIMTEWEKPTGEIILQMVDCLNSDKYLVKAPLYQQAFRWFREKYNLFASIEYSTTTQTDFVITINKKEVNDARDEDYKTYEEAELECLIKLIEIVKTK